MKAFLMYRASDFDLQQKGPLNEAALTQDLELNVLFNAMALNDKFLFEAARKGVLSGLHIGLDTILYRQDILKDCLKNAPIIRAIYALAVESIENEKKTYFGFFSKHPNMILHRSIEVLQMYVGMLVKLRNMADDHADQFESDGFTAFFSMLKKELSDEYFASIQNHLNELTFRDGILVSANLSQGNRGANYILRKAPLQKRCWIRRIFPPKPSRFTIQISERDESGSRALSELYDRGINLVANALAQSTDHILSFFTLLRAELAFYIGCMNLHGQLAQIGEPVSFPVPVSPVEHRHTFQGLYDVSLALSLKQRIVGNTLNADRMNLIAITGANQGGKSTFLRSIGLSQLMMQCGMFVPAEAFSANICDGLFTHYKREEDVSMNSGKLDEELSRMSDIADQITSKSMLLFNESFAATNEREGSEIARQIITALMEKRIKAFFVTHLFEFAHSLYDLRLDSAIFVRAERQIGGARTFKISEGEPLQTSYGEDLYVNRTFA